MENTNSNPQDTKALENMSLYNKLRSVPQEAIKPIKDGRLAGKSDINPMWRIKQMTEVFGPVSIGWKYEITRQWLETADTNNISAFCNVNVYIRDQKTGEWSDPIPGTGGNIYKRLERNGNVYVDDDCHKKALTDALSIAMKSLGVGADVWFEQDQSKYADSQSTKSSVSASTKQTTKPTLNPQSKYWMQSVTTAAATADDNKKIRERIEKKFTISDQDFNLLMQQAGRSTTANPLHS